MPRKYTRKDKINNKEEIKESTKNTQRKYSESFGIKSIVLNDKQKEFYDVINNNIITFCKSPAGCVDADTEYLSPDGWKKISEYDGTDFVLQFDSYSKEASFVKPLEYVKKPCDTFYHFKTDRSIDQMLSEEHEIAYVTSKGRVKKTPLKNFLKMSSYTKAPFSFKFKGKSLGLKENDIRLGVAIKADGYIKHTGICTFRLKKERKISRLQNLLNQLKISFKIRSEVKTGFTVITFYTKHTKTYKEWMFCSEQDASIIFDEYKYWDGDSNPQGNRLSRITFKSKEDADAIQFIQTRCGYRSTLATVVRDRIWYSNGKKYEYINNTLYTVTPTKVTEMSLRPVNRSTGKITEPSIVKYGDGFKYCFTVPSGYLVLRRNDKIFITGNSGKSFTALYYAVQNYLLNSSDDIIVIRTPVENNSDKIGFLPDTLEAKLEPHFASAKNILETLLTKGKVECDLGKRIHFKVPNYMLGSTLDNSVVIIDEAQALQPLILKLLLERVGINTKVIVLGDPTQLYVNDRSRNALSDAINRFCRTNHEGSVVPKYDNIGYFEFNIDDVVRSDIVKTVITAYSGD